jgi:hypothetical protein
LIDFIPSKCPQSIDLSKHCAFIPHLRPYVPKSPSSETSRSDDRFLPRPNASAALRLLLGDTTGGMADAEHESVRGRYFANEAFLIGMLQAVSGGSVVALLAQFDVLLGLVPKEVLIVSATLLVLALGSAVLAATWRYFYTLWNMKHPAALSKGEVERAERHRRDTAQALQDMRRVIPISVFLLLASYVVLLCGMWFRLLA